MRQTIIGTFDNTEDAQAAVDRLLQSGYSRDEISILMNGERSSRFVRDEASSADMVIRDAASGGLIGGALGAIIAASLAASGAIGAAIITGGAAAPFIAGPLAAALAGGGAGAAAGGIIGSLTGLGMTQEDSERVQQDIHHGRIVVTVVDKPQSPNEDLPVGNSFYPSNNLTKV